MREMALAKRVQARHLEEARLLSESKELLAQLGKLQQAQGAAAWWRAVALTLAAMLVAVALWALLGR